jgi:hypothetical protein
MSAAAAESRSAPPVRRWADGIPPAFLVAMAVTVVVGAVFSLLVAYGFHERPSDNGGWVANFLRYGRSLLSPGFGLATASLMVIGFGELVRRAGRGSDGIWLRIGLAAAVIILVSLLASLYMNHWYSARRAGSKELWQTVETFFKWQQRIVAAAAVVLSGSLLVAGRRLPLVQALAVPLLIVTVFSYPIREVWELTHDRRPSSGDLWISSFVDIAIDLAFAGTLLAVLGALGRRLPPPPVDLSRAGDGLQRVGSALVARVLVLVVAAFTVVTTFASHSVGLAKIIATVFPLGLLLASIALVTGMLQAGGLTAEGAPRKRLYAAAVFTLAALVVEGLKAIALYIALTGGTGEDFDVSSRREYAEQVMATLPYATPALALAGLLCLLWGVHALRAWVPEARIEYTGITGAAVSVTVFSVLAVAILRWGASSPRDLGVFVIVSLLVAIANVVAQLSVARACHRVAEAMRDSPALPTAVVAIKS